MFLYTVTPLSTTALFTAAGIARVKPLHTVPPFFCGKCVSDGVMILTGHYAATAILACLHARARTGHGYAIDLALLDCALASQVNVAQAYLTSGDVPQRGPTGIPDHRRGTDD